MEGYRGSSSSSSNSNGSQDSGHPDVSSSSGWPQRVAGDEESNPSEDALGGGGAVPSSTSDCPAGKPSRSKDQSFTAADSNSGSTTKSFVPCKVCGDKASGYHYGVTSCEGCKGFFRRSIQKKIEYRCLRDEKCLVIRLNRNRCQFCRFKKCLDVGMSRDSVRYGRVPKRTRERMEEQPIRQAEPDPTPPTPPAAPPQQQPKPLTQANVRALESRELALYDLTLSVSQAHHVNCDYTELKTRGIVRKPATFNLSEFSGEGGSLSPDTSVTLEQQKLTLWQQFSELLTPQIHRIVEFVKKIPGFSEHLLQDDQLRLIKRGFFEVWILYAARLAENALTFSDGSYFTRQQVEVMFDYEFMLGLFNFTSSISSMELSETEIALFAAITLMSSDQPIMHDMRTVDEIQDRLLDALKVQVAKHHPGDPNTFAVLMMKLSELRSLGHKHLEHMEWLKANWNRTSFPPLFCEIFDIPRIMGNQTTQQ